MPYIATSGTDKAVVFDPNNPFWFEKPSTTYVPKYGVLDVKLAYASSVYTFTRNTAAGTHTTTFNSSGQVTGWTDESGVVTTVTTSSGKITDLQRIINDGTNDNYESLHYDYYSGGGGDGRIEFLTYRRKVGSGGSWTNIRRVAYDYYKTGTSDYGVSGDLRSAEVQQLNGSTWETVYAYYYRYYLDGDELGFEHGLKFALGPEAYRRAFNDTRPCLKT